MVAGQVSGQVDLRIGKDRAGGPGPGQRVGEQRSWCGPTRRIWFGAADMVVGGVIRTTIERTCPLDGVSGALHHLGEGRALGELVIEIGSRRWE